MEEQLLALAIVLLLAFLVVPFVALAMVLGARKRITALEAEIGARKNELRFLYDQLKALQTAPAAKQPIPEPVIAPVTEPVTDDGPTAPAKPATQPAPVEKIEAPVLPPPPPPAPKAPPPPSVPFEQRLATYFTRIGAGALLLGALYFFKYAADNEWIGPAGRVLLGAIAGLAILIFAEVTRKTTKPAYTQIIVGVGLALLYICAWASAVLYQLISVPTAFVAETVILFVGASLAYRYRGEAVLVLVLLAGFANPVLLSTGVDRPLALFSYLLLLTTVCLAVSIAREFKLAIALSIAGVAVLFAGWYEKYFEVYDRRQLDFGDVPPERLVGAYLELSARVVPLAAAAAFLAQHLVTAFVLRSKGLLAGWPRVIAVVSVLLAHTAATALLYDRPLALGTVMIVLAAVSVFSFRFFDAMRFLLIPMAAAFLMLAGLTAETRSEDQVLLLGLLGAWAAIYLGAFLRDAWKRSENLPKNAAIQAAVGLAFFGVLGTIMMFGSSRYLAVAGICTAVSLAFVALAVRARMTSIITAALVGTFVPMISAAIAILYTTDYVSYPFLGFTAAWTAIYAAAIVRQLHLKIETRWLSLLTLSLAGLGGLALSIACTKDQVPTMRALITAAIGTADLMLALYVTRARPELKAWVRILAAQAMALFAPALAFGLSGATITIAWAVLAGTSMLILSESKDRVWLAVSITLAFATLVRVLFWDVEGVDTAMRSFEWTQGREGVLNVVAFANARGYALAGSGLAFLGGAFFMGRSAKATTPANKMLIVYAPIVATVAYGLLTTFLIVETRTALLELPAAPPMPLDQAEFSLFMQSVYEAKAVQQNLLDMTTTVILAFVAMTLLAIGFIAKDPFHRYLGLALFVGTLGKLVTWDVWNLPRIYQVVVLGVIGALLLGCGFLYARLKALFRGDAIAAAAILLLFVAPRAEAQKPGPPVVETHLYESTGSLEGVTAPGDYLFTLTPELYQKSLSAQLLADVRIADDKNGEIPFMVRFAPPEMSPNVVQPRMFDPGELGSGAYRATFEMPARIEHCEIELTLRGNSNYLRRTKIETGEKLDDFQLVSQGAIVYAVDVQGVRANSSTIRYPASLAKYLRVTLERDPDAQVTEIDGANVSCRRTASLPRTESLPLAIVATKQNVELRATEIELDAGAEGVPLDRLVLSAKTPEFVRRVQVLASSHRTGWPAVGSAVLYRVADGPAALSIPIESTRKRYFKIVIFNEDDAPLEITGAEGVYALRQLILRTPSSGAHALYTGDKKNMFPPRSYDLSEIIERRTELDLRPAKLGPLAANPTFGKAPEPAALPLTEKYRTAIGAGMAVVLAVLGVWAVRLIRSEKGT